MNIVYIHNELIKAGIGSYNSWLGKADGPYMVARPYNSKSKDARAYLVPIDDESDNAFIQFIIKDIKEKLKHRIEGVK